MPRVVASALAAILALCVIGAATIYLTYTLSVIGSGCDYTAANPCGAVEMLAIFFGLALALLTGGIAAALAFRITWWAFRTLAD